MICVKTNLKASLWFALDIYLKYTKRSETHTKQPSCIKRVWPSNSLGEKSCEIKGGGHEMAAVMLITIMHKAIIKI